MFRVLFAIGCSTTLKQVVSILCAENKFRKNANFFSNFGTLLRVYSISSKGFNQRDAYRVMLRKYPDVMNIEQMCDALRISTKTGYKLLHEGKIPAMKIGRSYRIPKAHLFTYLQICGQHCRAENRQC